MRNKLLSLLSAFIGTCFAPLEDRIKIKPTGEGEFLLYVRGSDNPAHICRIINCALTLPELESKVEAALVKLTGSIFNDSGALATQQVPYTPFNTVTRKPTENGIIAGSERVPFGVMTEIIHYAYPPTREILILNQVIELLSDAGLSVSRGTNRGMIGAPKPKSKKGRDIFDLPASGGSSSSSSLNMSQLPAFPTFGSGGSAEDNTTRSLTFDSSDDPFLSFYPDHQTAEDVPTWGHFFESLSTPAPTLDPQAFDLNDQDGSFTQWPNINIESDSNQG